MRQFIKHSFIYMLGDVLVRAGSFLLIPVYTRTLSSSEYGMVALVSLIAIAVSALAGLSMGSAVLKLCSEAGDAGTSTGISSTIVVFVLVWAGCCAGVLLLLAPPLLTVVSSGVISPAYVRIGVVTGCVSGVTNVLLTIFQKNHQPIRYRMVSFVAFLGNVATGLFMVVQLRWGGFGAVLAQMIGAVCGCLTALLSAGVAFRGPMETSAISSGLRIGIPLTLYAVGGIATDQFSRVFIERYVSMDALGVYNIAYLYCTVLSVVCGAINTAWLPRFFHQAPKPGSLEVSGYYGSVLIMVAIGIAGILSIISRDILNFAVAREYRGAADLVPLLMFNAFLSTAIWTVVMNPLVLKGRSWWITGCALASGACNIVLNMVLTSRYGVMGAALSSMGALLVLNGTAAVCSLRVYRIQYRYGRIALALTCAAVLFAVSRIFGAVDNAWGTGFRLFAAAVCAIGVILLLPRWLGQAEAVGTR